MIWDDEGQFDFPKILLGHYCEVLARGRCHVLLINAVTEGPGAENRKILWRFCPSSSLRTVWRARSILALQRVVATYWVRRINAVSIFCINDHSARKHSAGCPVIFQVSIQSRRLSDYSGIDSGVIAFED